VSYRINEIFYSLQGEGRRAGEPSVFVRFSGCNLACAIATHGFNCDTEFTSGRSMTGEEILAEVQRVGGRCKWVVLTGGEPTLQLDDLLVDLLHANEFMLAIETNGSNAIPMHLDWVCVSPKGAEHTLQQLTADEVKYVRRHGQGIPKPSVKATHKLISPAFDEGSIQEETLQWCIQLTKENPEWKLSMQQHKLWKVR